MKERFDGLVEHLLDGQLFLQQAIEILEKSMIQSALVRNHGNQCAAAKQLGIHRNTLNRKVAAYELGGARPGPPTGGGGPAPQAGGACGQSAQEEGRDRVSGGSPDMDLLIFDLDGTLIDSKL